MAEVADRPRGAAAPDGLGRSFWQLWSAAALSNLADGLVKIGLPLVAVTLTDSPGLVAGVTLAVTLPWLLFALPAGALADRLHTQPGTTLYHVRLLVRAGLLEPAPVRTGASGALEKPYRSTGLSWWLSGYGDSDEGEPYDDRDDDSSLASIVAFQAELREAGPGSVRTSARFMLHLSEDEVRELDRRLLAVLDEYIQTDHQRLDRPALGGIFVVHQLADPASDSPTPGP